MSLATSTDIPQALPTADVIDLRKKYVSPSLSVHYSEYKPLHIVKGDGLFLIDDAGTHYLDCINNVALVGHSHPRLVQVLRQQLANPSFRVSPDGTLLPDDRLLEDYMAKIFRTVPEADFDVILFLRSGSEANDLALSIAKAVTESTQVLVLDGAYHGHSQATMCLSTYKMNQATTNSTYKIATDAVIVPKPDIFRGQYKDPKTAGQLYADDVKAQMESVLSQGKGIAAFISEPFLGTAGQVPLPPGYLQTVYKYVREAGGLCIADEVQTGFARSGVKFWLHQTHGAIPDILVLGKPMANGHPISAVMTKSELVKKFTDKHGPHILNEFISDSLSLALANTVMDIISDEKLQENALSMGNYILERLKILKDKYSCIGDVRGIGLFIGVEIIKEVDNVKVADGVMAELLVKKALLEHNVLLKEDGVDHNVIKIKPPITFSKDNAEMLLNAIDRSLCSLMSS